MQKTNNYIFGLAFLLTASVFSAGSQACTLDRWSSSNGDVTVGTPGDTPTSVARVEQYCGLQLSGTGYVQDNSPIDSSDTRIRLRFYVLADAGDDEVTILQAFQDDLATSPAFSISLKPASNEVSFTPAGAPAADTPLPAPDKWVLLEIDWQAGGSLRYWVDDSPNGDDNNHTGQTAAGTATHIGMIRLGAPADFGDATRISFDAYHANRTAPVGGLLIGDANNTDGVDQADLTHVKNEILRISDTPEIPESWLSPGQPDCNKSGTVTPADLTCIKNIILGH